MQFADSVASESEVRVQHACIGTTCLNSIYSNGSPQYGTVRHEMGHAVGLEHEMNRCDRDYFITINFNNLFPQLHGQYQKYCDVEHQDLGLYDFESIMHYGKRNGAVGPVDVFIVDLKPSTRSDFRGFPGFCCANVERGTLSNGDNSSIDQLYRIVR